jgi:hypothetical protein
MSVVKFLNYDPNRKLVGNPNLKKARAKLRKLIKKSQAATRARETSKRRSKLTKAECYEQATAPVSDIETIIDELDQIESEAPKSMQLDISEARAHLRMAVDRLMELEA